MLLPLQEEYKGHQPNPRGRQEEGIVIVTQANIREPYAFPDRL